MAEQWQTEKYYPVVCPECGGTGVHHHVGDLAYPCPLCHETGQVDLVEEELVEHGLLRDVEPCKVCKGSGHTYAGADMHTFTCSWCDGRGQARVCRCGEQISTHLELNYPHLEGAGLVCGACLVHYHEGYKTWNGGLSLQAYMDLRVAALEREQQERGGVR
jgi:RecJ-like exonuclease